ncbi:MAG: hypothetical protein EXS14_05455 [Planctomycetes bacterium]|nr:hypothetical protein [Planctomycetota bacterium]
MFEIMNKYRVVILGLLFVGLFGWGAWGAVDALLSGSSSEDEVLASYTLPGETAPREIRTSDWLAVRQQIGGEQMLEYLAMILQVGDKTLDQFIFDYLVLRAAGEKAGIVVSDGDAMRLHKIFYGEPANAKQRPPEATLDFFKGLTCAQRFRMLFMRDAGGVGFDKLWASYKTDYEVLHGRAVIFEAQKAADMAFDPEGNDKDKKALIDFWDENQWMKDSNKLPAEADLQVAFVRYTDKSLAAFSTEFAAFAESVKDITVSAEDVVRRFELHKPAYAALLADESARVAREQEAEDKLAKTENREPKDLTPGDQPGEFERLKGRIHQELVLGRLLAKIGEEVTAGAELEVVAKKYGVAFTDMKKTTADSLQAQPEFGSPRVKQVVFGNGVEAFVAGKLKAGAIVPYESTNAAQFVAGCFDEPGSFQALFRLMDHRVERMPELKDIKEKVIAELKRRRSSEDLSKRGAEFHAAVKKAVEELPEVKALRATLTTERDVAVAKYIAEQQLSRDNAEHKDRVMLTEARFDRERDDKLMLESVQFEGAAFVAAAQAAGLEVVQVQPAHKLSAGAANWREGLTPEERRNRLFRTATVLHKLASTEVGRVTEPTYEANGGIGAVMLLDKRTPPAESDMLARPERSSAVGARLAERPAQDEWSYRNFKTAGWFSLSAPRTEEALKANEEERVRRSTADAARREVENRKKTEAAFKSRQAELEAAQQPANGATRDSKD